MKSQKNRKCLECDEQLLGRKDQKFCALFQELLAKQAQLQTVEVLLQSVALTVPLLDLQLRVIMVN